MYRPHASKVSSGSDESVNHSREILAIPLQGARPRERLMTQDKAEPWPTEIRLTDEGRLLTIAFDSGEAFSIPSPYLRKMTPSVEAKRLTDAERETLIGERQARITAIEAVGNYAIRPTFDDGHATGIYSWTYLAELGRKASKAQ
jgi:DUF971 family protein